jgi:saccharopine dehydrogenase-like NADP-dependent oxidoreductase
VERLEQAPRKMEIWAVTRDPAAADHPFPAPYSVRTLRDELQMRPMIVSRGHVEDVDPLTGEAEREFPEPIGQAQGIYTLHSEIATLPVAYPTLEEASFRLCLSPGLKEKLLALRDGDEPEPYAQSPESVAVHLVEVTNGNGRGVVGMTVTRGGSARSTSEPAARAAVELAEGSVSAPGVHAPEAAVADPEAFLAKLDTEVRWQ